MAIFYLAVDKLNRGNGASAVGRAAYILRADMTDDRTGERHYEAWRMNNHSAPVVDLHTWAPNGERLDPAELWNQAEAAERRRDAAVARSMIVAIPHEFTPEQQQRAATELMASIMQRYNVAVTGAIHADENNIHAHIMFTTREWNSENRTLGAKTRILDQKQTSYKEMNWIRHEWAEICNAKLEPENCICELSYKKQGIDKKPQLHLGPAGAAIERRKMAELSAIQTEITELEAEIGNFDITGTGLHQGRDKQTINRNNQSVGGTDQNAVGNNRRPDAARGIPSTGIVRQDNGHRTAAICRRTVMDDFRARIEEASGLAARWRAIRDHEAATSRRETQYGTEPAGTDEFRQ